MTLQNKKSLADRYYQRPSVPSAVTRKETRTLKDLMENACRTYADRVFLRYERNDSIYDVTYRHLGAECRAFAAWAGETGKLLGHQLHVGLLGSSGPHYIALMLGVMAGGAVCVPLDVQLDFQGLADCLNRSDVDVLFYDWSFLNRIEGIQERCAGLKEIRCLQRGRNVPCSEDLLTEYLELGTARGGAAAERSTAPHPTVRNADPDDSYLSADCVSESTDCVRERGPFVSVCPGTPDAVAPDTLAMILFTSGTTGRGKGVMLSHGNLTDNAFNYEEPGDPSRDTCLNVLPIHHVFCITCDILTTARYGGSVALSPDLTRISQGIRNFQPTVIRMVPMLAKALYNRIKSLQETHPGMTGAEAAHQVLGHRLRRLVAGGGYLTPELAEGYAALGILIRQGYGMSECAPKIAVPDWFRSDKTASVGHLVDGCQVRIAPLTSSKIEDVHFDSKIPNDAFPRDPVFRDIEEINTTDRNSHGAGSDNNTRHDHDAGHDLDTAPAQGAGKPGKTLTEGEIQVKSPSVMLGYYKDPESTAAALTEDGWLRTGDLGHLDAENFLYLTGRLKNLIILSNGENVAPEELENLFVEERLTEDVLVYGDDDMICAEIYPDFKYAEDHGIRDIDAAVNELVQEKNAKLPGFKRILRCHVRRTPFPKTTSKKIRRSAFFEELKAKKSSRLTVRLPETELQESIYELVAAQLGHREFGIDTDFSDAGLDSMGSIMLLSSLYETLKLSLTLDDLMRHKTVLDLEALSLERQKQEQVDYSIRKIYPLTTLQLYFCYVMRGNSTSNLPFCWKLDPEVDLERLVRAVKELFEVHPEMKDVIQKDADGVYKNFRDDNREVQVPVVDLSEETWLEKFPSLVRPFLYEDGEPLYHVGIYRTETNRYFFFDLAHSLGDGMSLNVIFDDLNRLYAGESVERSSYTYYEYILDERARDEAGLRAENVEYYKDLMKDFRVQRSILTRRNCYDLRHGHGAKLRNHFFGISRSRLKGYCQKFGVSENVLFLSAFNYCIALFSNEADTVSSSIHSGRTDSRWNRLVGPLFRTYLFRQKEQPHEKVAEFLKRSAAEILETMRCYITTQHPDEMFFQYQGDILNLDTIGGLPAEKQPITLDSLPFHLMIMNDWRGYYYELRYWENRFDMEQLQVFMTAYEAVVLAMMDVEAMDQIHGRLPETIYPKHYTVRAGELERALSLVRSRQGRLLPEISEDVRLKVYVLDDSLRKKPFGGWGRLYLLDHSFRGAEGAFQNPFGEGTIYASPYTARILPDGSLDLLEHSGRTIMMERTMGRSFPDLYRMEQALLQLPGVMDAACYVAYGENNSLPLCAELTAPEDGDPGNYTVEAVSAFLSEKLGDGFAPQIVTLKKR